MLLFLFSCSIDAVQDLSCDPSALPSGIDANEMGLLESAAVDYINADRDFFWEESDSAGPVTLSAEASEVARCHARDMCERAYFDHFSPDGQDVAGRIQEHLGYTLGDGLSALGENLALYQEVGTTGESATQEIIDRVMTSHHIGFMDECQCAEGCPSGKQAGHRDNILHPLWTEVGIGEWYCDADGAFYNVQVFWRREGIADLSKVHPYCDNGFTADPPDPHTTLVK